MNDRIKLLAIGLAVCAVLFIVADIATGQSFTGVGVIRTMEWHPQWVETRTATSGEGKTQSHSTSVIHHPAYWYVCADSESRVHCFSTGEYTGKDLSIGDKIIIQYRIGGYTGLSYGSNYGGKPKVGNAELVLPADNLSQSGMLLSSIFRRRGRRVQT